MESGTTARFVQASSVRISDRQPFAVCTTLNYLNRGQKKSVLIPGHSVTADFVKPHVNEIEDDDNACKVHKNDGVLLDIISEKGQNVNHSSVLVENVCTNVYDFDIDNELGVNEDTIFDVEKKSCYEDEHTKTQRVDNLQYELSKITHTNDFECVLEKTMELLFDTVMKHEILEAEPESEKFGSIILNEEENHAKGNKIVRSVSGIFDRSNKEYFKTQTLDKSEQASDVKVDATNDVVENNASVEYETDEPFAESLLSTDTNNSYPDTCFSPSMIGSMSILLKNHEEPAIPRIIIIPPSDSDALSVKSPVSPEFADMSLQFLGVSEHLPSPIEKESTPVKYVLTMSSFVKNSNVSEHISNTPVVFEGPDTVEGFKSEDDAREVKKNEDQSNNWSFWRYFKYPFVIIFSDCLGRPLISCFNLSARERTNAGTMLDSTTSPERKLEANLRRKKILWKVMGILFVAILLGGVIAGVVI
ncbi:hypothetical protein V1514DRAFT_14232 [Lipomyces japonicus]|uniref:uncharacterized protein n=1 Tax=Lipomyces japonicus TaxID=56871 RepID=UPI0034CDF6A4